MLEVFLFSLVVAFIGALLYDKVIKPTANRVVQWLKDFVQLNKEAYEALDEDLFELH